MIGEKRCQARVPGDNVGAGLLTKFQGCYMEIFVYNGSYRMGLTNIKSY
jgi:hypothetical protein